MYSLALKSYYVIIEHLLLDYHSYAIIFLIVKLRINSLQSTSFIKVFTICNETQCDRYIAPLPYTTSQKLVGDFRMNLKITDKSTKHNGVTFFTCLLGI